MTLFPKFRSSIVILKGRHFIPVGYSERNETRLIGLKNDSTDAQKYEVPVEAMDLLEPFGNLPYAVIGIKGGVLQVCPTDSYQVFSKPLCFPTKSFQEALHDASKNPVTKKPRKSHYNLKAPNEWASFHHSFYRTNMPGESFVYCCLLSSSLLFLCYQSTSSLLAPP
jgi:hypothetical protein